MEASSGWWKPPQGGWRLPSNAGKASGVKKAAGSSFLTNGPVLFRTCEEESYEAVF